MRTAEKDLCDDHREVVSINGKSGAATSISTKNPKR